MFLRRRPAIDVTLYGRPGCHLCEDAGRLLRRLRRRYNLHITDVDISGDPDLVRRYDIVIPVIRAGAEEISAPIREQDVRDLLERAVSSRPPEPSA
ncbi:MAG TPA: glutaredoxin family protein [Chloroflexota bacterium]|nr:glutaredoxin family protein [Chloroflexota bacterium]